MTRLIGINIPEEKKIKVALTYIYGIGRKNVYAILKHAKVDPEKRTNKLIAGEIASLQKAAETVITEGNLRKMVSENIKRLRQIGTYRGLRHAQRLPVRGQRTRTNARTKRGKRVTIGALKKELSQKIEAAQKEKGKE